jgi:hypothetical protein
MVVYMIDLQREICKPVLKLDFKVHGIMESHLGPYTERIDLLFELFFVKEIRRVIE